MDKDWKSLGKLKPEEKVHICIDMTDGCIQICTDGVRKHFPDLSEEDITEKVRERLEWSKHNHRNEK